MEVGTLETGDETLLVVARCSCEDRIITRLGSPLWDLWLANHLSEGNSVITVSNG